MHCTYLKEKIEPIKTLEEVKQWLGQHKSLLQDVIKVRELGVFGSYVRQEQTETSDVDVLVEFSENTEPIEIYQFINIHNWELHRGGLCLCSSEFIRTRIHAGDLLLFFKFYVHLC
ncbi:nucleotidyltransferase family protein [Gloeocapsopsis dulcis]|uniref:nucleotidyltransferase family protein n=1 Tax=Gloeocapsopsis dulcis TaxID=2859516 RepID=UPI001F4926DC|nr:nucleotidyltransferase domain-containing protein [Gloeocapsopsis dulcis]WNN88554.1 nucleotidyltransferase domain-containing protein [Gloeocapsopsis dulcis]